MLTDKKLAFRHGLQGLRAVAILLVILAHSGLAIVQGGFIGVDVFFVLSGYLITGLLLCELEISGRISIMSFYARRLKRLLPALIFMLSISFGSAVWILSEVEARAQLASSQFAATWTSNLYFAFTKVDYFNELASRDLFLHTWSLGVEEQFYLIWPMVLLVFYWFGRSLTWTNHNGLKLMFPGLILTFIVSFVLSLYWSIHMPQAAFYLMPSRIWQCSLGAIVCFIFRSDLFDEKRKKQFCSKKLTFITLGTGMILIIGSAIVLNPNLAYPGLWIFLPSIGAALVIVSDHTLARNQNSPLAHPVLVWFGDRSYSLYLWHWPIFILGFSMGFKNQTVPIISMVLLSILISILSFRMIELPFWKGRWSHAKPLRIILPSLLIMAIAILLMDHGLRQLPQADSFGDISNNPRTDIPIIYRMSCDDWYENARVEPCVFGAETASKTVVLLGDSVGAQWFSIIPEIFPEPHWRTIVLTKSSCPMVDEDWYYPRLGKVYQVCTTWRNAVLDYLDTIKPDVLFIGSASTYNFTETQWIEGSSRVFKRVSKAATSVYVIPGTPSLGFDGPGCVSRNISPEGVFYRMKCIAKEGMKDVEPVTKFLEKSANSIANVYILNLNDLVCPLGECGAISEEGDLVFRDSQHLMDSFVRAKKSIIHERLKLLNKD